MASYLQVENISKYWGEKTLFDHISFNINEGDKIALIAPNGTGKSTLLSILAGKESSDRGGEVKFLKDISIAFLEQEFEYDHDNTIFEAVFQSAGFISDTVKEYELAIKSGDEKRLSKAMLAMDTVGGWNYEQRIDEILTSLKLPDRNQQMSKLSGGEVKRVALAVVLLKDADFLILDEPTNHLDMEIIEYLEGYLTKSRSTVFMVTHDRYFLDRVCNTILELENGTLYTYKGNYSYFLEKKQERQENQSAEVNKARNLYRRELEWINATPCARTGKAKYRIDAFQDLKTRIASPSQDTKISINVNSARLGNKIINCKHVSKNFGNRCMLDDFTYNFNRFEKIGIVGSNGVGKSTFLNLMTGALKPDSGIIEVGETIKFGYYHQSGIHFNENDTIFDVVHNIAETVKLADGKTVSVSTFLNYFLFPPNTHDIKVSKLSGGERRRLYLMTVLMKSPNFLILDEPTNDLDILTLNVLEDYLKDFPGCLLIVSHDRYFLDKLADHILIFTGSGQVKDYAGKCSEYRSFINDYMKSHPDARLASQANSTIKDKNTTEGKLSGREKYEADKKAANTGNKRKMTFKEKIEYKNIEKELSDLNEEKLSIEESLNNIIDKPEKIVELSKRLSELINIIDEKEMRWLELDELNN